MNTRQAGLALCFALMAPDVRAQGTWLQRHPTNSPPVRYLHAMAYDPVRDRTVLFGGKDGPVFFSDSWEWDGTDWSNIASSNSPSARWGSRMWFDHTRQKVLMFGGNAHGFGFTNQTWEWDGQDWTFLDPDTTPTALYMPGVAYDTDRNRAVVFGGRTTPAFEDTSAETWEWDGTDWRELNPTTSPPSRFGHSLAYDSIARLTILSGGRDANGNDLYDTWAWDGSEWVVLDPPATPSGAYIAAMVAPLSGSRLIRFGGLDGASTFSDATWEWRDSAWHLLPTSQNPVARGNHAVAYHESTRSLVLFGGGSGVGVGLGDTWELKRGPISESFGSACPGSAGTPNLAPVLGEPPTLGGTFFLQLTSLPQDQPALLVAGFAQTSPWDLSVLGMPGCAAYIRPDVFIPLANEAGVALWSLFVPNDTSFVGVTFFCQGVAVDPGVNPAGLTVSNAVEAVIGIK